MPVPGGAAAKYGDRYEGRWAAQCLLDVVSGEAHRIRFEPPGPEGEGVEFWMERGARREYWQVKRQLAGRAGWTPHDLTAVLQAFWPHLQTGGDCVFASTQSIADIPDLVDRARRSQDPAEFAEHFLTSEKLRNAFQFLMNAWDASPEDTYEALRHISIHTADEEHLVRLLRSNAELRLIGDPMTAVDVLTAFALDSVHIELSVEEVLAHLQSRGYSRRDWNDASGRARIDELNNAFMNPLRRAAIGGRSISRTETQAISDLLFRGEGSRCVLVGGEAGVGKSGVLLELIEGVRSRGWPTLALRVDRLEPVLTPSKVGSQLGLPGSPTTVLAGIAQGGDALLVIDQVDAVSLASGRHPEFLDCVLEMVHEARLHANLRVLISVRTYDAENDPRLKAFAESSPPVDSVKIDVLTVEQTRRALAELGVDTAGIGDDRIELFRLPLHLSLLAEAGGPSAGPITGFSSRAELFSKYWDHKTRMVSARLRRDARWTRVVDILCDSMSKRQRLFVPEPLLDDLADDLRAMASEGVVIVDEGRVSFFHQSFFDYAFARRFLVRSGSVLDFLLAGEQHLFRRTQVRAVLELQRVRDFDAYVSNLSAVFGNEAIRYHVRRSVFDMLADVSEPTAAEWAVVKAELEADRDPDSAWRLLGKRAWFHVADAAGSVSPLFASDVESTVDRAVQLATIVMRSGDLKASDRVAEILSQYVGNGQSWANRLRYIAMWCEPGTSRGYFDLFLRLLSSGVIDDARGPIAVNSDFWSIPYALPKRHADWAAELIGCYLRRRSQLADENGVANPFDGADPIIRDSQVTETIFRETVEGDPFAFLNEVLPWIIETASKNRVTRADREIDTDAIWGLQIFGWGHSFESQLFSATELALQRIASTHPDALRGFIRSLKSANLVSCHHLAMRAYAAAPELADDAIDYLLELPELSVGYIDSTYAVTRDLIKSAAPHCTEDRIGALSKRLLDYYSSWERSEDGRKSFGHAQFLLLSAIPADRRTDEVSRRLAELDRKFGSSASDEEPREIEVKAVPPPISGEASAKMTDEQWLAAMARYDDDTVHHRSIDEVFGDAFQLAQVLGDRAKEDPERFSKLLDKMPDHAHRSYFDAILNALADSGISDDVLVAACARCHRLEGRPCGTAICRAIRKRAEGKLPVSALDMIAWYATQDADPASDRGNVWSEDDRDSARDLLTKAINCVRGEAADAIGALLFADFERLPSLVEAVVAVSNDERTIVRITAAHALLAILRCDRDLAVALLLQLTDTPDDRLLKTHYVERALFFSARTHFDLIRGVIERMLASDDGETAEIGARLACVASLTEDEAAALSRRCLSPEASSRLRQGAAGVYAANVASAHLREECERALLTLFHDPESAVRGEAAECFRGFSGSDLGNFADLVAGFLDSPAFQEHHFDVLRALDETSAAMPAVMCLACERFVEKVGPEGGDIRTAASAHAEMVCRLALRVYATSHELELRTRALNVIDQMMKYNYHGLEQAIGAYAV